jgi:hypothetical protein
MKLSEVGAARVKLGGELTPDELKVKGGKVGLKINKISLFKKNASFFFIVYFSYPW